MAAPRLTTCDFNVTFRIGIDSGEIRSHVGWEAARTVKAQRYKIYREELMEGKCTLRSSIIKRNEQGRSDDMRNQQPSYAQEKQRRAKSARGSREVSSIHRDAIKMTGGSAMQDARQKRGV